MADRPCYWVEDDGVPGGRFLVPGCWNRALHGDDAECQCVGGSLPLQDRMSELIEEMDRIVIQVAALKSEVMEGKPDV